MPNYLDIFAGAGGLSEGFIRAGYEPIAHIEMDKAACYTLKTRLAYKWLSEHQESATYMRYLKREITRKELYVTVPEELIKSVLNYEISKDNLEEIFQKVDRLLNGEAAARELKRMGTIPLPSTESMKTELVDLAGKKETLLAEYRAARNQA